jgi:K+-sensing histidine kinase KdpD
MEALSGCTQGKIHLKFHKNAAQLEIHVMDNGPGYPKELLEKELRAYAAAHKDSALGLSSVECFAHSLDGLLDFSNRESDGARAKLLLPVDCQDKATTST